MPDDLMKRANGAMAARHVTFKELVTDALERSLRDKPERFVLREASAGCRAGKGTAVSSAKINQLIDEIRETGSVR
jgi:hypothetical protein